ncbi:MAG: GyrI-like domain-containing protein [Oscillospiraceae bacterium]|nr:GyrI-like domain-containing protein [Oscillospiraceae bacterium]
MPDGFGVEIIPATTWAVFPVDRASEEGDVLGHAYDKIVSEWLPLSNYVRNEAAPRLEIYGDIFPEVPDNYLEVWAPFIKK